MNVWLLDVGNVLMMCAIIVRIGSFSPLAVLWD